MLGEQVKPKKANIKRHKNLEKLIKKFLRFIETYADPF